MILKRHQTLGFTSACSVVCVHQSVPEQVKQIMIQGI